MIIKKFMKKIYVLILFFSLLLNYQVTFAQDYTINDPFGNKYKSVTEIIAKFIDFIINLGIVAVVLFFVYTGFQFVAAKGNPDAINKAKTSMMWTVVGTLVLIGGKVLVKVLENTLSGLTT